MKIYISKKVVFDSNKASCPFWRFVPLAYQPYWRLTYPTSLLVPMSVRLNEESGGDFVLSCECGCFSIQQFLLSGCVLVVVTAVQCPTPENPAHGKAIFTSCSYNSVVSHECDYGYTLVGEATRRCGADKKWSGTMPKCQGTSPTHNFLFTYRVLMNLLHSSTACVIAFWLVIDKFLSVRFNYLFVLTLNLHNYDKGIKPCLH